MNRRLFSVIPLVLGLLSTITPSQAQGTAGGAGLSAPVNLSFNNGASQGTGTLKIKRFNVVGQEVRAYGTLTFIQGTTSYVRAVSIPVVLPQGSRAGTTATCDILSLTLGPLHLDLLGLVVDLNQVVLNITAESGPGNLLGNLLCAIANLLNGPDLGALLQQLVNALNIIIGLLG